MGAEPLPPGLRRNQNWRRLWLAQAVSLTGDSIFDITVFLWVTTIIAKHRSWAPAAASGVLIAEALPVLVVGPLAGVWIDRWDRRRTMMTADACRAVLVASLLTLPALGHHVPVAGQIAVAYTVVAAQSSFAQFFNPSRLAILGLVVCPQDRPQASGMLQATSNTAQVVGPPLAAPMLFTLGVQWALVADAVSFVISFAAIRAICVPAAECGPTGARSDFHAEFREGLSYFAGNPVLVALCVGVAIATLGTGALNALQVFFLRDNLHTAPGMLGLLYAAAGAGAVAGALLGAWVAARISPARVFWLGLLLGGALLLSYSQTTIFPAGVITVALAGSMFGALNAAAPPLFLANIPQGLIGRVMSVFNPIQQVAAIVSMATAGLLVGVLHNVHVTVAGLAFGPISTIFAASAVLIIAAGLAVIGPLRGPGGRHRSHHRRVG